SAGVGLIGGSLGLAARGRSLVGEVVGYGRSEENLRIARDRGAIDRYSRSPEEAAAGADLVVLAVPVRSSRPVAERMLPHAREDAVVIDVGSVKGHVVESLSPLVLPPAAIERQRVADRAPLSYSGGGLRDTTRIASSHAEMWRDIFLDNRAEVLRAIDQFSAAVERLRLMIDREESAPLEAELGRVRRA